MRNIIQIYMHYALYTYENMRRSTENKLKKKRKNENERK